MSSEFNFKSGWNNKAPPPALAQLFRNSHNTNTAKSRPAEKGKDFEKKSESGNARQEISSNKNSNTNYGVQKGFQHNLRNSQNTRDDLENPASILSRDQNSFRTSPGNTFNSNHRESFVYDTHTNDDEDVGDNDSDEESFIRLGQGDINGNKSPLGLGDKNQNNYEELGRESDGAGPGILSNPQSQSNQPSQSDFQAQEFHADYFQSTDVGGSVGVPGDHIRAEHNGLDQNFAPIQSNQEFRHESNPSFPSGGKSVVINLANQNINSQPENQNQFLPFDQTTEFFFIGGFVSDDFSFQQNQNSLPVKQDFNFNNEFIFSSPPADGSFSVVKDELSFSKQNTFNTNFPTSQDLRIVDDTVSPKQNLSTSQFSGGSNGVVNSFGRQQQQQQQSNHNASQTQKEFIFENADFNFAQHNVIDGSSLVPDVPAGHTPAHTLNNAFSENSSPALSNDATSSFARQNLFSAPDPPEPFKRPDKVLKPSELLGTATGKSIQKNVKVASVAASSGGALVSSGLTGSYTSPPTNAPSLGSSVNDNNYKSSQSVQNVPISSYHPSPSVSIPLPSPHLTTNTDRPSNSDLFKPPSTLLYGFVPMTTEKVTSFNPLQTISGPQSVRPSGSVAGATPINYKKPSKKPSYKPGNKSKPSYKPSPGHKRNPKHLVIDAISRLLAPITETLSNLLRG